MARMRGRAKRGERCRALIPDGHWKTTTFTGALRLRGMTAPMVLDGPMNGDAFRAYIEQVLVPTLTPGDVVIMDNLPAHRATCIREAIEAAGARLRYLPPYSPDFNPIENALKPPQRPSTVCGIPSVPPSHSSHPPSAPTISPQLDMSRIDRNLL
jgi:hypothetical protein